MSVAMSIFAAILYFIAIGCAILGMSILIRITISITGSKTMDTDDIVCLLMSVSSMAMDIFMIVDRAVHLGVMYRFISIMHDKLQFIGNIDVTIGLLSVAGIVFIVRGVWLIAMNFMSDMYCGDLHMCRAAFDVNIGGSLLYLATYAVSIYLT